MAIEADLRPRLEDGDRASHLVGLAAVVDRPANAFLLDRPGADRGGDPERQLHLHRLPVESLARARQVSGLIVRGGAQFVFARGQRRVIDPADEVAVFLRRRQRLPDARAHPADLDFAAAEPGDRIGDLHRDPGRVSSGGVFEAELRGFGVEAQLDRQRGVFGLLVAGGVFAPEPQFPFAGRGDGQVVESRDRRSAAAVADAFAAADPADSVVRGGDRRPVGFGGVLPGDVEFVAVPPGFAAFDRTGGRAGGGVVDPRSDRG